MAGRGDLKLGPVAVVAQNLGWDGCKVAAIYFILLFVEELFDIFTNELSRFKMSFPGRFR